MAYGSESWTLSRSTMELLNRFETKLFWIIAVPICENGVLRRRKIENCMQPSFIKIQRLKCLGHVLRMDIKTVKKLYKDSPAVVWPRGQPRSRWSDSVLSQLKQLRINIFLAQGRYGWRTVVEQAKVCCTNEEDEIEEDLELWIDEEMADRHESYLKTKSPKRRQFCEAAWLSTRKYLPERNTGVTLPQQRTDTCYI